MIVDRREEFKDVPWTQGKLISTNVTKSWNDEEKKIGEYNENCRAFVNFSFKDQGRSRILIYVYSDPNECKNSITEHNKTINKYLLSRELKYEN